MKLVPLKVSRAIGQKTVMAKHNSPHLFFGGGVIGVVVSTVMACRATLKLEDTVDEIQKDFDKLKVAGSSDVQSKTRIYISSAQKIGMLYGPAVLIGGVSIAALTGSHVQLTRRNAAVTATLAAATRAYEEYRVRVQEEIGEERELELHRGISDGKTEDGKKIKDVTVGSSPYIHLFARNTTDQWKNNQELNRNFLECQERIFNYRLTVDGFVLLNDVLKELGLKKTSAGAILGWVLDKNGDSRGDGYISFGTFEGRNFRMVGSGSNDVDDLSIWLDFNCDGIVHDLIDHI